jgi:hypothetical protein
VFKVVRVRLDAIPTSRKLCEEFGQTVVVEAHPRHVKKLQRVAEVTQGAPLTASSFVYTLVCRHPVSQPRYPDLVCFSA